MTARALTDCDVEGPTLYHGYAGVLQATHHTRLAIADTAAHAITDPTTRFGFQHHDHDETQNAPGLLTPAPRA